MLPTVREGLLKSTEVCAPLTAPDNPLSAVLEEDILLSKVLGYLIDDGLPQCRRVSRKWRRICNQLPVKLYHVEEKELNEIGERFPRAASVTFENSYNLKRGALTHVSQESIELLGTFQCLRHWAIPIDLCCPCFILSATSLAPVSELTSLTLDVSSGASFPNLYNSLRRLTNLTRLKMMDLRDPISEMVGPFTELVHIQDLSMSYQLFSCTKSACMFPSLTRLTRLELCAYRNLTAQDALEVCIVVL